MNYDDFKQILKKNSLRITRERKIIFEQLYRSFKPLSHSEIVDLTYGKLDQSTVYRNLEVFRNIGIIHRVNKGWKFDVELTEKFNSHHHHMVCLGCSTVIDFQESKLFTDELVKISSSSNFRQKNHSLEIYGICENCAKLD